MDSKIPSPSQAEWPEGDGILFLRRDGVPSLSSSSPAQVVAADLPRRRRTCVPAFRVIYAPNYIVKSISGCRVGLIPLLPFFKLEQGLDGFSFNQFNSINSGILIVTVRNGFGAFSDGLIRLIL